MSDEDKRNEETKRLLLKAEMELDTIAAFQTQHKQAFRIAFDFLNACFPPTREETYWESTVELFKHRLEDNRFNPLVKHLLLGAYNYLGEIVKDLPEKEKGDEG